MMALFLDRGADINYCDYDDDRPLDSAAAFGNIETIRFLLRRGADAKARNRIGQTALFQAKNEAVIRVLLQYGAEINAQDNEGETALLNASRAAVYSEYSVNIRAQAKAQVKFLLLHGADPNLKNNRDQSALENVKKFGYANLVKKAGEKAERENNAGLHQK